MSLRNSITALRQHDRPTALMAAGGMALTGAFLYVFLLAQPFANNPASLGGLTTAQLVDHSVETALDEAALSSSADTPEATSHVSSTSVGSDSDGASVSVKVNGTPIDVPRNGHLHRVIEKEGSRTVLDVQTSHNGTSSSFSHTTTTSSVTTSGGLHDSSVTVHRSN